ncbi:1-acyl-sn-glycerol-3-phosphate acyltransferase [Brevibacillus laterosporus]|uniref:1-acyl-sn-glycerol-3-phosphate acyltransferase n=1 Tax=Brevibacillus laterosporus TaxID=1465 RepID=A0A502ITR6_BRELA|nr:lysophospholipid acyltransferase family protein [Brevibacillus laterosporus]QDX93759.1 1-acyl-sn-glycerol-3-phosphate acyltransferase [Brevibacillus laterosporus]RAP30692.1 1-acyl-sn-glycerol-3-phosphate acyltransferase [Brevibacillus laterosporus]TPG73419.1 1-acyl-sn-glycerol-3-phosphate acyltransferase [Brevibacillus laterosporus]TPG89603.1 1-acyl-sn-glycerol-3-phosphate acyltransferase [Brevibacillus laterosporus]
MILYKFFRGAFRIALKGLYRFESIGYENVPDEGPVILCSNHISNWDPPLLGCGIERQVCYMAKEELFKLPVVSYVMKSFSAIPVKRGGNDRGAIRATLQILEQGKVFGIFPEGTRSKTGELGEGKTGIAMFALKSQADVVPVAVIGPYRLFHKVKVVYGKPIDLSKYREAKSSSETMREVTQVIMSEIQKLKDAHQQ